MSKKSILVILVLMLVSVGGITIYNTFAYDEEASKLEDSNADYNLIYSLKENSNKYVSVAQKDEKFIDIELTNTYPATVRYGMYYLLANPSVMPSNVEIKLSDDSPNQAEDILKSAESKTISIRITNNSEYNIDLVVGALIGFEHGDINELVKKGEVLIK